MSIGSLNVWLVSQILYFTMVEADLICYFEINHLDEIVCNSIHNQIGDTLSITLEKKPERPVLAIDLSFCRIKNFTSELFKDYRDIQKLDLSYNRIFIIENDMFTGLNKLKYLALNGNTMAHIKEYAFVPLLQLEVLDLSDNYLDMERDDTPIFTYIPNLKYLDVSMNNFIDLSEIPGKQLKSLRSNRSSVKASDKKLDMPMIVNLDLTNNPIGALNKDMLSLAVNLMNLDLINCSLTNIPLDTFKENKMLTKLNISHNKIDALSDNAFQHCRRLTILDLSYNSITSLTENIFYENAQLQFISLKGNKLRSVATSSFYGLRNIRFLDLSKNQLIDLPNNLFAINLNLRYLYLNNNKFISFDNNMLVNNKKLLILDVSYNSIVDFNFKIVKQLNSLQMLNLDNNRLTRIVTNFTLLPRIKHLHISCNRLVRLPEDFFKRSKQSIRIIYLHGNPFQCSCLMQALSKVTVRINKNGFIDGKSITCVARRDLENCEFETWERYEFLKWADAYRESSDSCRFDDLSTY